MFPRFNYTEATILMILLLALAASSGSETEDSFVFGGCSEAKFVGNSPYELDVNSILASLVNSAGMSGSSYNSFTSHSVRGLFQCRGDLPPSRCSRCVAAAVTRLGGLCLNSCGGALQLDACFVKYDNATFLGVQDKTVVASKCTGMGQQLHGDAVLDYLGATDGPFRVGGSGDLQAVAQCVGDLSPAQCQDCLSQAIRRLKTECAGAASGDMYLAKCYARYSQIHSPSHSHAPCSFLPAASSFILILITTALINTINH